MDPMYKLAKKVIDEALVFILNAQTIEPHELRCLIEMMNDITLDYRTNATFKKAKNNMILLIDRAIENDDQLWFKSYVTKPSQLSNIIHH